MNHEQAKRAEECFAQELLTLNIAVTPYVELMEIDDWNEDDILMTHIWYHGWEKGGQEILCYSDLNPNNFDDPDEFDRNFIGIFGAEELSSITVTPHSLLNRNRGKLWLEIQAVLQKRLDIKTPTLYLRICPTRTSRRLMADNQCESASADALIRRLKPSFIATNGDVSLRVDLGDDYSVSNCFSDDVINRVVQVAS